MEARLNWRRMPSLPSSGFCHLHVIVQLKQQGGEPYRATARRLIAPQGRSSSVGGKRDSLAEVLSPQPQPLQPVVDQFGRRAELSRDINGRRDRRPRRS